MTDVLVAFFSVSGVTRRVAQLVGMAADADFFELQPALPYTQEDLDWEDPRSRSSQEHDNPASRPALLRLPPDLESYSTIFVGYPLWWGEAPRLIDTFLEQVPDGTRIIPFATSAETPAEESGRRLQETFGARLQVLPAVRLEQDSAAVQAWVRTQMHM